MLVLGESLSALLQVRNSPLAPQVALLARAIDGRLELDSSHPSVFWVSEDLDQNQTQQPAAEPSSS